MPTSVMCNNAVTVLTQEQHLALNENLENYAYYAAF